MANLLKKIRLKTGLPQHKFAVVLGQSQAAVSYYETGERDPNRQTLSKYLQIGKQHGLKIDQRTLIDYLERDINLPSKTTGRIVTTNP